MELSSNEEYEHRLNDLFKITQEFVNGLMFIGNDASRGGDYWNHHLLSTVFDDILESTFGIYILARGGGSNSAKRELRYLLELAIKVCYIEQSTPQKSLENKVTDASALLNSTNIGVKRQLELALLTEPLREDFRQELGRLYGSASGWVHVTVEQINDRIDRLRRDITAGKEGVCELNQLIKQVERCFAAVLVLFLHSVPSWIAGDLLVESDGSSHKWFFAKSRFIADMDSLFDYKAERQKTLDKIKSTRSEQVQF